MRAFLVSGGCGGVVWLGDVCVADSMIGGGSNNGSV